MRMRLINKTEVGIRRQAPTLMNALHLISLSLFLVSTLIFTLNVYRYQNGILDDAFITYRFARHLAQGEGLVWNIGGERVEGYTSLLHVALLAGMIKIGFQPELASLWLSILAVLATVGMLTLILYRHFGSLYPPAALVIGLYLTDQVTVANTVKGLETQLFPFLLCLTYFLALSFIDVQNWKTALFLGITVFLSVLGRPEGVLYGLAVYGVLGVYLVLKLWQKELSRKVIQLYLFSIVVLVALGLVYASWKYAYFGYLFPNTFYVKSNQLSLNGLKTVAQYGIHLISLYAPLMLGYFIFIPIERVSRSLRRLDNWVKVLLTGAPPLLALLYYITITHEVGGDYRFAYPTYFYFLAGLGFFVSFVTRQAVKNRERWINLSLVTLVCFTLLFTIQENWRLLRLPPEQFPVPDFNQYHYKIGEALKSTGLGAQATILNDAAGIIPYISEFNQVDRVGLVNNQLSGRENLSPEGREVYMWSQDLDVYVGYEPPASPGFDQAGSDPRMESAYVRDVLMKQTGSISNRIFAKDVKLLYVRMQELRDRWFWVGEIEWPGWNAWRLKSFVYVRKDSPYFDLLVEKLETIVERDPSQVNLEDIR